MSGKRKIPKRMFPNGLTTISRHAVEVKPGEYQPPQKPPKNKVLKSYWCEIEQCVKEAWVWKG